MKAAEVYANLEKDFIKPALSDDWAAHMQGISDFLSDNFRQRSMGVVCDFTDSISHVYTAVFPSDLVMQTILDDDVKNALLFVHHPAIWDIRTAPKVFQPMNRQLLEQFRERKIAIYNLHVPLDDYGEYATSVTLAKALDITPEQPFGLYFGALAGVFGKTKMKTVEELRKKFEEVIGHKTSLYQYGAPEIANEKVALIAGGGNDEEMLEEVVQQGINTFVTGITALNDHSRKAHDYAKKHKLNILGGTHYSTETFACIAMVDYFKKLGLSAEYVADIPVMEDL